MKKQKMRDLTLLEAPEGYDPLDAQRELQRHMLTRFPEGPILADEGATVAETTMVTYLNAQAAIVELCEMLDHLPYKWWKDHGESLDATLAEHDADTGDISEAKYELVDALHFMLNCAIALGMDWREIIDTFYTKQQHNHDRQERGY